jgi:type IX secretion system PorP/SprF family membrane protein
MRKICAIAFFTVAFCATQLQAQDRLFSQFYATPVALNPALAGAFDGKYRIGGVYRDQWRSLVETPITSFSFASDLRMNLPFMPNGWDKDRMGIGLAFQRDRVANLEFSNTQINIATAYHKLLNAGDNTQYLSLGFQIGLNQRNVNYDKLTFQDQFNGIDDFSGTSLERLPENNFGYADLATGLHYSYNKKSSRFGFFTGIAYHHFAQPNISFYRNIDSTSNARLKPRVSLHAAVQVPMGDYLTLTPRLYATLQSQHFQVNAGANLRFPIGANTAMQVGGWWRPVKNFGAFNFNSADNVSYGSIVLLTGIEFNNILFGMSYDWNFSNRLNLRRASNAFEVSLIFLGDFENDELMCPTF